MCILINSFAIPKKKASFFETLPPAFVITIFGFDKEVPTVMSLFKKYANLDLYAFYGIDGNTVYEKEKLQDQTAGERGLRETMKKFFNITIQRNYKQVFVFEDDAIPHVNFTTLFKHLPNRCCEADVLLLGASMWHKNKTQWPSGPCFDADQLTRGAFALFIKQSAFIPIMKWLEKDSNVPYDHMYTHLQQQGLIVRVAYPPFLAIADVSRGSSVKNHRNKIQYNIKKRALQHDWHLENYPVTSVVFRVQ